MSEILAVLLFGSFLVFLAVDGYRSGLWEQKRSQTRENIATLHNALELYADENYGIYPHDLNVLKAEGDLDKFPVNPWSGEPMHQVSFEAPLCEGNYTYIPYEYDGEVIGYYLIGYTSEVQENVDVNGDRVDDHVLLVESSNYDNPDSEINIPSLRELLTTEDEESISDLDLIL